MSDEDFLSEELSLRSLASLLDQGQQFADAADFEAALNRYDQALDLQPDCEDAWSGRGMALHQLGRYPAALVSFDRALELVWGGGWVVG